MGSPSSLAVGSGTCGLGGICRACASRTSSSAPTRPAARLQLAGRAAGSWRLVRWARGRGGYAGGPRRTTRRSAAQLGGSFGTMSRLSGRVPGEPTSPGSLWPDGSRGRRDDAYGSGRIGRMTRRDAVCARVFCRSARSGLRAGSASQMTNPPSSFMTLPRKSVTPIRTADLFNSSRDAWSVPYPAHETVHPAMRRLLGWLTFRSCCGISVPSTRGARSADFERPTGSPNAA